MEIYRHDSDRSVGVSNPATTPNKRLEPQLPSIHSPFNGLSGTYERNFRQHGDAFGYTSTSTRYQLNSVYDFPPPPPPPALPSRPLVEYGGSNGYSHSQVSSHTTQPVRKASLIQRLSTVVPRRLSRQQGYGALGEDDGAQQDVHHKDVTDGEDRINFDLSGFEGPIALDDLSAGRGSNKNGLGKSTGAILTTQYEKPDWPRISRLGEGMGTIKRAPIGDLSSFEGGHFHTDSYVNFRARNDVQQLAETSGEIVMLEGLLTIFSSF